MRWDSPDVGEGGEDKRDEPVDGWNIKSENFGSAQCITVGSEQALLRKVEDAKVDIAEQRIIKLQSQKQTCGSNNFLGTNCAETNVINLL